MERARFQPCRGARPESRTEGPLSAGSKPRPSCSGSALVNDPGWIGEPVHGRFREAGGVCDILEAGQDHRSMTSTASLAANFQGLTVAAFESRRASEMATLVSRHGGVPVVAPAMREIALEPNAAAEAFGKALLANELNAVIFMTGAGVAALLATLEKSCERAIIVQALSRTAVVARGSKTVRALESVGVRIAVKVPEPNTWREVLPALEDAASGFGIKGSRVALQEYGVPDERLVAEIEARGASVVRVPVYRWDLPEDTEPLERVLDEIVAGRARVVLFTNAVQVNHLIAVAAQKGTDRSLRDSLSRAVVCSIGPTCSEALAAHGLNVDLEPELHKMGILVHEAARRAPELLSAKAGPAPVVPTETRVAAPPRSAAVGVSPGAAKAAERGSWASSRPAWRDSRFMKACRLEPADATPVWLMRQAGRYMTAYRELRARVPFLELCKQPDLVAEVTVSAARQIGADAAILFADLLLPAEPMGFKVDYERGGGPHVDPALRSAAQISRLPEFGVREALGYVFDAVRQTRASLDERTPLIGFAGAPFTLASYLIEGGPSRSFRHTKSLMYSDPGAWRALMDYLVRNVVAYINGQIESGAQAVQIFDSWVGCLAPSAYREFVLPHMKKLFHALTPGAPVIHFGTGTAQLLELMREAGGSVIGLDFRVELDDAWRRLGPGVGVQGNLDPAILFAEARTIREHAVRILRQAAAKPGHIFNLGHGVLPETPPDHVTELVNIVHDESARLAFEARNGNPEGGSKKHEG